MKKVYWEPAPAPVHRIFVTTSTTGASTLWFTRYMA